jgi:hypothetical protein
MEGVSYLDGLDLILINKRRRLSFNYRLNHNPLNRLLPQLNLVKPLGASVRTSLRRSLPGDQFLFIVGANLDRSQITAHSGGIGVWLE